MLTSASPLSLHRATYTRRTLECAAMGERSTMGLSLRLSSSIVRPAQVRSCDLHGGFCLLSCGSSARLWLFGGGVLFNRTHPLHVLDRQALFNLPCCRGSPSTCSSPPRSTPPCFEDPCCHSAPPRRQASRCPHRSPKQNRPSSPREAR